MLKDFLKEVISLVVGKPAEGIADLLYSKIHVNEFILAKKLGITINQTRNILYKIADHGLVSYIRKKDKRKGWYTYFWKIEVLKTLEFLKAEILRRMEQINDQIKSREVKQFYVCPLCHVEFTEENALLHDFACPECGNILAIKDNAPVLKELNRNLNKLNRDLSEIEVEVGKEKEKVEEVRVKEIKKIVAEKKRKSSIALKKRRKESAKKKKELEAAKPKKKINKSSKSKKPNKAKKYSSKGKSRR